MNKISINHKILGLTVIQKTQNYNKLVPGFNSCVGGEKLIEERLIDCCHQHLRLRLLSDLQQID